MWFLLANSLLQERRALKCQVKNSTGFILKGSAGLWRIYSVSLVCRANTPLRNKVEGYLNLQFERFAGSWENLSNSFFPFDWKANRRRFLYHRVYNLISCINTWNCSLSFSYRRICFLSIAKSWETDRIHKLGWATLSVNMDNFAFFMYREINPWPLPGYWGSFTKWYLKVITFKYSWFKHNRMVVGGDVRQAVVGKAFEKFYLPSLVFQRCTILIFLQVRISWGRLFFGTV